MNPEQQEILSTAIELEKLHASMSDTLSPLRDDAITSTDSLQSNPSSQYLRRIWLRCTFAYTEALLWGMKQHITHIAKLTKTQLTNDQCAFCREKRIKKDGTEATMFLPVHDNIKMTFPLFATAHAAKYEVDSQTSGFRALAKAVEIRNGLMHPKSSSDVILTNEAMIKTEAGYKWLHDNYKALIEHLESVSHQRIAQELKGKKLTQADIQFLTAHGIHYLDNSADNPNNSTGSR